MRRIIAQLRSLFTSSGTRRRGAGTRRGLVSRLIAALKAFFGGGRRRR